MWCNRYSYGYAVAVYVYVCMCVHAEPSAQRSCDGDKKIVVRSFVETLLGALPYPKSVEQRRQHCVPLYCFATSVFGRLQHQNVDLVFVSVT